MKKIFYFLFAFIIILLGMRVKANEINLVKERIGDLYTCYYDNNLGRTRFLYLNKYLFGDNYAYCIELGKNIFDNNYTYSTSLDGIGLDNFDLEYIKLASYYGYDYPGHNTDRFYMATQELIWKRLSNIDIKWVNNLNENDEVKVTEEKDIIEDLIYNHYKVPSFGGAIYDIYKGKDLILTDYHYVLDNYETDNKYVKIEGNKVIIDGNIDTNEVVFKKKIKSNKVFLLYSNGLSQKMISSGKIKDIKTTLKLTIIGGSITINKLDSKNGNLSLGEASLDGAKYGLYNKNNTLVGEFITGIQNTIDGLPLGEYYIKEITPSKGYRLDENTYKVNIDRYNLDVKLDVYEDIIERKVDIFKTFASDKTGLLTSEEGVSFEIYDKNKALVKTITTDENGYASLTLPYGTYTLKQINSPIGYEKIEDQTIIIDKYDDRPIYKLFSDAKIKSKIKIIKRDLDTGEVVTNSLSKFKIYDVDKKEYLSFNGTNIFETNEDGYYITPEALPSGKYQIFEVDDKLNNYLYNKDYVEFEINDSSNFVKDGDERLLEVLFYNKIVKGKIELHKYGEDIIYNNNSYKYKEILLSSVIFKVYTKDNIYENGKLIYSKDTLVGEIITDNNGYGILDNLPLGEYYIKEISSNKDNQVNNSIYNIKLDYKDQYTGIVTENIDIYNYLNKGKLTINKLDEDTNKPIPNTLIEIKKDSGETIYKGYTDDNGQIILDDIKYGDYYLSEVESSTGYKLLEENISFTIDKEDNSLDIYNEHIMVPNTGISFNIVIIIVISLLVLSILLIIFLHKYKIINIISLIIIILSLSFLMLSYYQIRNDKIKSSKAVEAYLENKIGYNYEEKYNYKSVLEIPSLNIKKGILEIDNKYNDANYNVELVKKTDNIIVLASHNGNSYNSFFGNLHNLELGDEINYYENNNIYKYIYSDSYEIKKDGYADLYHKNNKKCIILITCKDNSNDAQVVYIGYLKEIINR